MYSRHLFTVSLDLAESKPARPEELKNNLPCCDKHKNPWVTNAAQASNSSKH